MGENNRETFGHKRFTRRRQEVVKSILSIASVVRCGFEPVLAQNTSPNQVVLSVSFYSVTHKKSGLVELLFDEKTFTREVVDLKLVRGLVVKALDMAEKQGPGGKNVV